MQYYPQTTYYRGEDNRGLLLPLLVGAAVGFPFGYIASNTNKNNYNNYAPMPYPVQPYPMYPMQSVQYYPPYPYMPY
ncbi:MAG: hypothetical protein K2N64_07195 [Anaeroplasmataceae bacterium]|nr:hypothetical protein [Anaeroplasmataceae bacterium]